MDIFLYSHHLSLRDIVLISKGEIISWLIVKDLNALVGL